MSLPKIVNDLAAKLVDLPAILAHVVRLVAQLETLAEQQDRIEAKLDQLIEQSNQPVLEPAIMPGELEVTPDTDAAKTKGAKK